MQTPPGEAWSGLIEDYARWLSVHDHEPVFNEMGYRQSMSQLLARHRERDPQRLLVRFRRQHQPVIDFAKAVDATNGFEAPHALQALVWQLLKRAIQIGLGSNLRFAAVVEETNRLNSRFPALTILSLTRYQNDFRVRSPLQRIFRAYIDCYCNMFSDLSTLPIVLSLDHFHEQIPNAQESFNTSVMALEEGLKAAEDEEKIRIQSIPLTPNSMLALGESLVSNDASAHFTHVRDIGNGSYGDVSVVRETTNGTLYAQKLIRVLDGRNSKVVEAIAKQVQKEVDIMHRLSHEHITSIRLSIREGAAFRLILLPVADCNLREFLEGCCDGSQVRDDMKPPESWFGCLISALTFAHGKEIKHEDIKPSNILIKDNQPFLADFGSAVDFSKLESSMTSYQQDAGTPVYWPPETQDRRGRAPDVFALGCVFSEILTVCRGRSLAEYRAARYVADTDYGYAFRNNLSAVQGWLRNLPGMTARGSVQELLLRTTVRMLERSPSDRYDAREAKRSFRGYSERLFCPTCEP